MAFEGWIGRRPRSPSGEPTEPAEPPAPSGWLDFELTGELTPPLALVQGWALAERGLGSVEVEIEGEPPVRARLFSIRRPDVAASWSEPSAPIAGWEALVEVGHEPGSRVTVTATAISDGARTILGSGELAVGSSTRTAVADRAWVDTLAQRAGAAAEAQSSPRSSSGLRLLVFAHRLNIGGAQFFLRELLRPMLSDPEVSCLVLGPDDGPERAELERLGASVHITGPLPAQGPAYESRMRELALLAGSFEANAVLANTSICFPGVDLAGRLGIPAVWAIHESEPIQHQLNAPIDDYLRERFLAALGSADRLVFAADSTRDVYRGLGDEERMVRIDYGLDLAGLEANRRPLERDRLRAEHGFDPVERLIVCIATVEPRKGQALLALAFGRLADRHPNARLAFVGDSDSSYSAGLHEAVARLPCAERITIAPLTTDPGAWHEMADVFALASDIESLPISVLEAMAFGVPVLAAAAFGIGELIEDGVNGVLCEPRCLDSLTEAMDRLLSLDDAQLAALGLAGQRSIRARHDLSEASAAYRAVLDQLVGGPVAPIEARRPG